jgi:GDPmannose 4,6-dehydratase
MRVALITGITGQDGSYLAEYLLEKGYKVFGFIRRSATPNLENIEHILSDIELLEGDLLDQSSISKAVRKAHPREVYNLASQSFVGSSWDMPIYMGGVAGLGAARVLEACVYHDINIRFYQASSSEMFGSSPAPQDELTPFHPRSPYGVAKVYAHLITQNYRESYGMYACSGILFNHESPRRGHEFVTRKIAKGVARVWSERHLLIPSGPQGFSKRPVPPIRLGNLQAKRDWGHAKDYVRAMWLMLNHREPLDLVIGTGVEYSVLDFVKKAFEAAGIENHLDFIEVDESLIRPAEVEHLVANYDAAKDQLGWNPEISFDSLVSQMVRSEIDRLEV